MRRRLLVLMLGLMLAVTPLSVSANPPPLPPLPPASVINSVLASQGGAQFVPLDAPNLVFTRLAQFTGVLAGVQNQIDRMQAVSFIGTTGRVVEQVIPVANSRTLQLRPTLTTPGSSPRPGMVLGVAFHPHQPQNRRVMVVVAVFPPGSQNCTTNCPDPEKIRMYHNSTQYNEFSIEVGDYTDTDNDGGVEQVDEGAAISQRFTCFTIGLEQVCWQPSDHNVLRQRDQPKDIAYDAYTEFKDLYDLEVDFYVDDAVPDILGYNARTACAGQMVTHSNFSQPLSNCTPNVVFGASKEEIAGQPIALFIALAPIDLRAYTHTGNYVGTLPAGEYLVMDAMSNVTTPGAPMVSFLVGQNGNHFLIPAVRTQGFGIGTGQDARQAGIRDGFASWRGWGG
jgi:hypothetical protein